MAYLHCHTPGCGWSQDDFWSESGWNPISAVKENDSEKKLFEEKIYMDKNFLDRKSTRLNSSHIQKSRMPSSA